MRRYKVDRFHERYPDIPFPPVRELSEIEARHLLEKWRKVLRLPDRATSLEILRSMVDRPAEFVETGASRAEFDLGSFFSQAGLATQGRVLINWHRLDVIDEMERRDLFRHFHDIWYPSADDIEIFDHTLAWVVGVAHDGYVSFYDVLAPPTEDAIE